MPKSTESKWNPNTKRYETYETGQDESLTDREKFDPSLKPVQTQEDVEAGGGLAAAAARAKKKREQSSAEQAKALATPMPRPRPRPRDAE